MDSNTYTKEPMVVLGRYGDRVWGISLRQVRIIRNNWAAGQPWWLCSPMYALDKYTLTRLASMSEEELDAITEQDAWLEKNTER